MTFPGYKSPPSEKCPLRIKGEEIHLWRIGLKREFSIARNLLEYLSPQEQSRASGFHFKKDFRDFILTRIAVKEILGRYLDIKPNRVCFSYNRYGKPVLDKTAGTELLYFNVSRSREMALCAVCREREIGVDVEFVSGEPANMEVAERFFSERETLNLMTLPANERTAAFFRCWTRKEAFVKAVGKGLWYPLQSFSVPVGEEELAEISIVDEASRLRRWSLKTINFEPNHIAALAVEGEISEIKFREWGN